MHIVLTALHRALLTLGLIDRITNLTIIAAITGLQIILSDLIVLRTLLMNATGLGTGGAHRDSLPSVGGLVVSGRKLHSLLCHLLHLCRRILLPWSLIGAEDLLDLVDRFLLLLVRLSETLEDLLFLAL